MKCIKRSDRSVLALGGEDRFSFLQGLVSNDVIHADGSRAVYAALLTPQGKFLADFFIIGDGERLLLDCPAADAESLLKKLNMYKLRAKVTLENLGEAVHIYALFGADSLSALDLGQGQHVLDGGIIAYADPRLADAGARAFVPAKADPKALGGEEASEEEYQRHRIALGLPEAPTDLIADKSILLESGFDELHGVDWKKGCYMGQELTARTKYRGLIKKRLVPVSFDGGPITPGAAITLDGKNVGEVRSVSNAGGIAMLRLEAIRAGAPLDIDGNIAHAHVPDWMIIPDVETAD